MLLLLPPLLLAAAAAAAPVPRPLPAAASADAAAAAAAPAAPADAGAVLLPAFHTPPTKAAWSVPPAANASAAGFGRSPTVAAMAHLRSALSFGPGVGMTQKTCHVSNGKLFCYVQETVDGVEIANAVASVVADATDGTIISRTSAWVAIDDSHRAALAKRAVLDEISPLDAVAAFAKVMGEPFSRDDAIVVPPADNSTGVTVITGIAFAVAPINASPKLYLAESGLKPVWDVAVPMASAWVNVFVDRHTSELLGAANWMSTLKLSDDGKHLLVPRQVAAASPSPRAAASTTAARRTTTSAAPASRTTTRAATRTATLTATATASATRVSPIPPLPSATGAGAAASSTSPLPPLPAVTYRVVPIGSRDPTKGRRLVVSPIDRDASPLGWHDTNNGFGSVGATMGNNVIAQENRKNLQNFLQGLRPALTDFNFDFNFDDKNLQPSQYADASITNAFFLTNAYHDILYKYGFDEKAGNFQVDNLGRGGISGDPVLANVQDGSGTNNANFATPPDGQAGLMRMFVFTQTSPQRDGAMENSVVLHELTHGLSNRLTGGPSNVNCLQTKESGGMGEGWSDMVAVMIETLPTDTRKTVRVMGGYITGNTQRGVRRFPYSTDLKIDPHMYSEVPTATSVHVIGEVWASMLYEVFWNLIEKLGFQVNIRDGAKSGKGNTVFLQLLVDGLKLQPCNPTFVDARDAFIKADQINNNGANRCEIFRGFAKRGLGAGAISGVFRNNFDLPAGC
ncbi:hypothetical protein HK105_201338 [Polyrhizophydium stewartii]|uniref:Extracellular metalloproteinase n=1 Tax=Polyrhizophydium stewartii TaxID=2732419 RepID=A0ABR4NHR2_9FUNG